MITLRNATIDDAVILNVWDEQPHVIESDPNDDWHWEEELLKEHDWREMLIAENDNTPIGFIQIIDPAREETHYWGDIEYGYRAVDIWIGDIENTCKGYGREMMMQTLQRCFSDSSVKAVLIDPLASNTRAIRFYERLGFQFVEDRTFGEDACKVYQITRTVWNNLRNQTN